MRQGCRTVLRGIREQAYDRATTSTSMELPELGGPERDPEQVGQDVAFLVEPVVVPAHRDHESLARQPPELRVAAEAVADVPPHRLVVGPRIARHPEAVALPEPARVEARH